MDSILMKAGVRSVDFILMKEWGRSIDFILMIKWQSPVFQCNCADEEREKQTLLFGSPLKIASSLCHANKTKKIRPISASSSWYGSTKTAQNCNTNHCNDRGLNNNNNQFNDCGLNP